MLRDITLGQYYQTESVIHKLDPRVKLIATICFIISLFVVKSWIGYAVAAVFLAVVIRLSQRRPSPRWRSRWNRRRRIL